MARALAHVGGRGRVPERGRALRSRRVAGEGVAVIGPDGIQIGVPISLKGPPPGTPLAEVGADFADLPHANVVRAPAGKGTSVALIASHALTHQRSHPP